MSAEEEVHDGRDPRPANSKSSTRPMHPVILRPKAFCAGILEAGAPDERRQRAPVVTGGPPKKLAPSAARARLVARVSAIRSPLGDAARQLAEREGEWRQPDARAPKALEGKRPVATDGCDGRGVARPPPAAAS